MHTWCRSPPELARWRHEGIRRCQHPASTNQRPNMVAHVYRVLCSGSGKNSRGSVERTAAGRVGARACTGLWPNSQGPEQRRARGLRGLKYLTIEDIFLAHTCTAMEVNSHQSVENLQTSATAPSPGAGGASDAAPNGGGGGLEVLGQAVESTTTAPSKESPAEAAPAPAPTTGNGSSAGTSRNQNENHHFDLSPRHLHLAPSQLASRCWRTILL